MHVPVERALIDANPQVAIFAPYDRDKVMLARNLERVPTLDAMPRLANQRIAVPGKSLACWVPMAAPTRSSSPRSGKTAARRPMP